MIEINYLKSTDLYLVIKIWKTQKGVFGIPYKSEILSMINNKQFLCAKYDKKIIGICGFKIMKKEPEIRICHLWVAKKFRKKHIALQLLNKILEINDDNLSLVAHCRDGAENNNFYEKIKHKDFTLIKRETINVRRYFLDKDKIKKVIR